MKSLLPLATLSAVLAAAASSQAGETYVAAPPMAPMTPTPEEKAWTFGLAIYGWGAGLEGDVTLDGFSADFDSSFSDIWDNLDVGIMATVSAHYDRWGFYADFIYLALSNDARLSRATEPGYDHAELELDTFMATLVATYRVIDEPGGYLELGGGGRVLYTDTELTLRDRRHFDEFPRLRPVSFGDSRDNWDAVGALRAGVNFGGGWALNFYGDVGAGDSDLTWQVQATLAYWFTPSFSVAGGYRHLAYEWDGDGDDEIDLEFSGPVLGVVFRF
ncbi:MAG TPA: hypothetical protein VMN36_10235 [Verrucomicrobiales bacterium]|nr:hypothetical protein [Verrucomicrobiales bacterium]